MFTHLLLLKKGGYVTYFGPIGKREGDFSVLLDYYAKLGFHCPPHKNPAGMNFFQQSQQQTTQTNRFLLCADFILEVNASGVPDPTDENDNPEPLDLAEIYLHSDLYKETRRKLKKGIFPKTDEDEESEEGEEMEEDGEEKEKEEEDTEEEEEDDDSDDEEDEEKEKDEEEGKKKGEQKKKEESSLSTEAEEEEGQGSWLKRPGQKVIAVKSRFSGRYATPFHVQFYEVMKRNFISYWRDPIGVRGKMMRSLLMVFVSFSPFMLANIFLVVRHTNSYIFLETLTGSPVGHVVPSNGQYTKRRIQ